MNTARASFVRNDSKLMKAKLFLAFCLFPFCAPLMSCREKGPAEKTGEQIDKAAENIKDAVDPAGPAERAGEKIDRATGR